MARYPQNAPQIEQLIRLSAASRSRLSLDVAALQRRLEMPTRALHSLRRHPLAWLGGSLAAGVAATLLLRRKPPAAAPKPHRSLGRTLGSLAVTAARPFIETWLTVQLKQFLATQFHAVQLRARPAANPAARARA